MTGGFSEIKNRKIDVKPSINEKKVVEITFKKVSDNYYLLLFYYHFKAENGNRITFNDQITLIL